MAVTVFEIQEKTISANDLDVWGQGGRSVGHARL